MEESEFKIYLANNGLTDTSFWEPLLKDIGIECVASLKQQDKTSSLSKLVSKARNEEEKEALFQVFACDQWQEIEEINCEVNMEAGIKAMQARLMSKKETKTTLHRCSEGKAFQGKLVSKDCNTKLQKRSDLIEVSKSLLRKGTTKIEVMTFNSEDEECNFRHMMNVLGYDAACAYKRAGKSGPKFNNQMGNSEKHSQESYFSTVKYKLLQAATITFDVKNMHLSHYAKCTLEAMKELEKNKANVHKSCIDFFEKFGSHINIGPHRFGGWWMWTCSSRGFKKKEKQDVIQMQSAIIKHGTTDADQIYAIKQMYQSNSLESTLAKTTLQFDVAGGPSKYKCLAEWQDALIKNSNTWVLFDQGIEQVAIWDIIKLNYQNELGEVPLMSAWEETTGLKPAQLKLVHNSDEILEKINRWNKESIITFQEIKEKLDFLFSAKKEAIKISGEESWVYDYLSKQPMQQFFKSVVSSQLTPADMEEVRCSMKSIADLEDKDMLKTLCECSDVTLILKWIFSSSLAESATVDFEIFNSFIRDTLREQSKHLTVDLKIFFKKLKYLQLRYQNTSFEVFLNIILQPVQASFESHKPISYCDIERLQKSFAHEKELFSKYYVEGSLNLQAYLIILTLKACPDPPTTEYKFFIQKIFENMTNVHPPLNRSILQKVREFYEDFDIMNLNCYGVYIK